MKKNITIGIQRVFGLVFIIFGLNGFFSFLPAFPPSAEAVAFYEAMSQTGYLIPFEKVTEIFCGAALLGNIYAPLAIAFLAPIVINIVLFHIFLNPAGLPMAIMILVAEFFLILAYKDNFRKVLE